MILRQSAEESKRWKKKLPTDYIRKPGAGRPYIDETYPNIHQVFLEIVQENTAGCPMNSHIKWTYLTPKEIVEKLAQKGISVSTPVVSDLLKIHGFKKRKMSKSRTIKEVKDRDEQFKKLNNHRLKVGGFRLSAESTDTGPRPVIRPQF